MQEQWIEHDGKDMPVTAETVVQVKYRDGEISEEIDPAHEWHYGKEGVSLWVWDGCAESSDIVDYRIVE